MPQSPLTRRQFVAGAAAFAGAALTGCQIVPRHAVARSGKTPPSERLNLAFIGAGGRATANLDGLDQKNNILALCDVDEDRAAPSYEKYPKAQRFVDFRGMLDKLDNQIDAVVVSTPDHTHAIAAITAMQMGKHVYCEKPMAHTIGEVRAMIRTARQHNVVTQLGNQGHSTSTIRMFCEWIWDGAIGNVHTVNAGCDSINSGLKHLDIVRQGTPVPPTVNWDLWLGPARKRPYHPAYLPAHWRGWTAFGDGTIGDWCCHVLDPVFWALDLGAPKTISAKVKDYDFKTQGEAFPRGDVITFEFAAKGQRGPVTVNWFSGEEPVPLPADLEAGRRAIDTGAAVIGDKGTITYGSHGAAGCRIVPEAKMQEYKRPEPSIPRVTDHYEDWTTAVKTGTRAGSDFAYGGALTELALLGIIAVKMHGTKLEWDGEAARFTNCEEANAFVNPPARRGWQI